MLWGETLKTMYSAVEYFLTMVLSTLCTFALEDILCALLLVVLCVLL